MSLTYFDLTLFASDGDIAKRQGRRLQIFYPQFKSGYRLNSITVSLGFQSIKLVRNNFSVFLNYDI